MHRKIISSDIGYVLSNTMADMRDFAIIKLARSAFLRLSISWRIFIDFVKKRVTQVQIELPLEFIRLS